MTSTIDRSDTAVLVVGASRGLGLGIATALADAGARVTAVARTAMPPSTAGAIDHEPANAAEADVAARLLQRHDPRVLVIVAGAMPPVAPLHEQTWEEFSVNWHSDTQIAFRWVGAALSQPLRPGSHVIVISSGAALQGSPLSGGYAGAKATQRFIAAYARDEANRGGLGITFTTVLPRLTPLTDLGRPAVRAYAARGNQSEAEYLQRFGEPLTPQGAGTAVLELVDAAPADLAPEYVLTGAGLMQPGSPSQ